VTLISQPHLVAVDGDEAFSGHFVNRVVQFGRVDTSHAGADLVNSTLEVSFAQRLAFGQIQEHNNSYDVEELLNFQGQLTNHQCLLRLCSSENKKVVSRGISIFDTKTQPTRIGRQISNLDNYKLTREQIQPQNKGQNQNPASEKVLPEKLCNNKPKQQHTNKN
jgi:hypothetical protein